jgi:hypothetical protein
VRTEHAVCPAGPYDRDLRDRLGAAAALRDQHLAEGPVSEDARVVVDTAVALGLADDSHHPVGVQHPGVDQLRQLAGIGHVVQRHLADLDRLGHGPTS